MSSDDVLISVRNLGKTYRIFRRPGDRLKEAFTFGRVRFHEEFPALCDISFDIRKGETVGIIGRNGSGKSTLLQLICGILRPTAGSVAVNGSVAALLELGTGFNLEFTGRENVFFQGAIMGFAEAQMAERFDDIEAFAEIGAFIDQPVRTYSSGMFARLAFSVAVHLAPDILVVDEALSVGDMAFQEKAISHMKKIRERGVAILFVSHSLPAIRNFCDTAIWLDKGAIREMGERLHVCESYQEHIHRERQNRRDHDLDHSARPHRSERLPSDQSVLIAATRLSKPAYAMGEQIEISIDLKFLKAVDCYGVGLLFFDSQGNLVSMLNTLRDDIFLREPVATVSVLIANNHFTPGEYSITASVSDENGMFAYDRVEACAGFSIAAQYSSRGLPAVEGILRCEHEWRY